MHQLPCLQPGDSIEIIAPAARCADQQLLAMQELLTSWQLQCIVQDKIFADDLLCANTDANRLQFLIQALQNPQTKAIVCARGGYGCMRLIPSLAHLQKPLHPKLFIGMSDITALHLFFQQQWQWPTLHGALALDKFSNESIAALKSVLFGTVTEVVFSGLPLNAIAKEHKTLEAILTGGNLCLVATSIGTLWQINSKQKIIFLEDTNERGYHVDRMLEHLRQANLFQEAAAIVFGDFIQGHEADGKSLIQPVLTRFAAECTIPVVQITGVGHGFTNLALPLGTTTQLQLGETIRLTCST